jgi:hypothetical protein
VDCLGPPAVNSDATKATMNVDELEVFCDEGIRLARQAGYTPTVFQGMRARHGTVPAIEKLVLSGDVQSGFKRLKGLGLLQWSIEAAVLKFPDRFSTNAKQCAEFRLSLAEKVGAL